MSIWQQVVTSCGCGALSRSPPQQPAEGPCTHSTERRDTVAWVGPSVARVPSAITGGQWRGERGERLPGGEQRTGRQPAGRPHPIPFRDVPRQGVSKVHFGERSAPKSPLTFSNYLKRSGREVWTDRDAMTQALPKTQSHAQTRDFPRPLPRGHGLPGGQRAPNQSSLLAPLTEPFPSTAAVSVNPFPQRASAEVSPPSLLSAGV